MSDSKSGLLAKLANSINDQGEISGVDSAAVQSLVDVSVNSLVNSAPDTLNTLDELAAALNDDANFATTVTNSLATKASTSYVDSAVGAIQGFSGSYGDLTGIPINLDTANKLSFSVTEPATPEQYDLWFNPSTAKWNKGIVNPVPQSVQNSQISSIYSTQTNGSPRSELLTADATNWTVANASAARYIYIVFAEPLWLTSWTGVADLIGLNQLVLEDGTAISGAAVYSGTGATGTYNISYGGTSVYSGGWFSHSKISQIRIQVKANTGSRNVTLLASGGIVFDEIDPGYATDSDVAVAIANLVDAAPDTLDTLNELAAALGDDANFATTVTNSLATKANSADLATVATSGSYNDLSNKPSIPSISGLATTSYVDTAVADAGSSDTVGTETTNGNTITLDYSTGNVFNIDVEGAANNNIIELSNSSSIAKFKVKLNASRVVSGAYGVVGAVQQQTQALSTATGSASYGLTFSPDGTKMFVGGYGFSGNHIGQFNLTTPFDPSTVTSTSPVSIQGYGSSYLAGYGGHCWNSNGTRAYVMIGASSANYWSAWAINLNTPYDFEGGTYGSAGSGSVGARAFACTLFSSNTFLVYDYAGTVYVKSGSPGGSTVSSRTWTSMGGTGQARDFAVSPDGTKLVAVTSNGYIQYFEFATAYDIENISSLTSYAGYTNMGGVAFNDDGTKFFTVTGGNGTARTVYEWEPELTIVDPAISFDTTGGETFVGSVPGLTHNQSSYMELSTIDGGSTYYIITPNSGGGGSGGQVLAEYHAVCNGSALGDATTESVTAVQNLTTTYTDASGSVISGFTVPSGTNKIVYQYNAMLSWADATNPISHWKLFFSTDGSSWTEVVNARRNPASGSYADTYLSFSWPFEINAASADTDSGKLTATDSDTYYFKWQAREYGVNNEMKLHSTQYWDASGTDQFSMPTVSIKCLS